VHVRFIGISVPIHVCPFGEIEVVGAIVSILSNVRVLIIELSPSVILMDTISDQVVFVFGVYVIVSPSIELNPFPPCVSTDAVIFSQDHAVAFDHIFQL
jgi:hypothetical protein